MRTDRANRDRLQRLNLHPVSFDSEGNGPKKRRKGSF